MGEVANMDLAKANALLDEVNRQPTLARIATAARELSPHARDLAPVSLRLACTSSYTFDPVEPALKLQGLRAGFAFDTYVGPYGQFDRELIDPASGLAQFSPQVVVLAVRLADVCPAIYESFNSLSESEGRGLLDDWFARLESALRTFRQRCDAHLLVTNYDLPVAPALGLADRSATFSQEAMIRGANDRLRQVAASMPNVHVLDYDALVARHGRATWSDRRMALYARIPVSAANYWNFAGFLVRHLRPLYGLTRKVLVLDADNTLWGGVLGDVGLDGIALGPDYPGSAFAAFQRRVLDLYHRGIVLCIASKNEPGTVQEALEKHPNMVLRPRNFAAMRVNWEPKPKNLQELAADLNLGIDSFVFMDDSDVECDLMRQTLPQVLTITLPKEPAEYAAVVEALDCFDQWKISSEDRKRGELYRAEAGRKHLAAAAVDMPTFYRQLEMRVSLRVNDTSQVARAAQMTNRTNQFNMHTIRYAEDDVRRFMSDSGSEVVTLALSDRFGDNGVVGLAVIRKKPQAWVLHQFLMSCRILGRTVEKAFVSWIAGRAKAAGATELVGEFVPTAKNKPFSGFYASCGFVPGEPDGAVQRMVLSLASADVTLPDWITLEVATGLEHT